jgi:hypothetical protein
MSRNGVIGIAVVVVLALCGITTTSALGLPVVLPESSSERNWTGKNVGTGIMETTGGEVIECTAAAAEGTEESKKPLGAYHIDYKTCSTLGGLALCHSLGDEAGVILSLGSWHFVFDTLGATLGQAGVGILLLVADVHIECAGTLILVFAGGMMLCLVTKPTTSNRTHEFTCKSKATGVPLELTYYNETGTKVRIATLLVSKSGETATELVYIAGGIFSESTALEIML